MKIFLILCFFLNISCSFAEEAKVNSLSAHSVDYDGKNIRLGGGVTIEHHFGMVSCEKAVISLKNIEESKKTKVGFDPDRMLLHGNVKIQLRDGSHLLSDEADINCQDLEGTFIANPPQKVVYITHLEEDGSKIPIKVTARAMRLKMDKNDKDESSKYHFSSIQGEDAVTIEYQNPTKEGK